jgi:hypothetical protein
VLVKARHAHQNKGIFDRESDASYRLKTRRDVGERNASSRLIRMDKLAQTRKTISFVCEAWRAEQRADAEAEVDAVVIPCQIYIRLLSSEE